MTPALTGCLVHTRSVLKTRLPDIVRNATLDQLLKQVDERNAAIQSMTLYVRMSTSTGGSLQGEVKESQLQWIHHCRQAGADQRDSDIAHRG